MTHDEATEVAGVYVLDALEAPERETVRRHLEECTRPHPEFEEVGGVVPALARLVEPVDAPPELRERVLAAIAAEATAEDTGVLAPAGAPTRVSEFEPDPSARPAQSPPDLAPAPARRSSWLAWTAAVLLIAVLGVSSVTLQRRTDELEQRGALIAQAIAASAAEGSEVATLRGTGPAAGASGFAVFTAAGEGYILLVGLPPAPAGQTYQAWYIVDGQPFSAGVVSVGGDGYALLAGLEHMPGTDVVALTLEPAGGVDAPTTDPIVTGEVGA